ncbi:D-TA family PLP-dependent enzyme [Pareuzebyella sediminis]|uniref:D-TA family PLP-dependent enzyme n=1 Tax=Pareuzebyella sediminis TaxID=2607998 RepID=UPI0011EC5B97|nr:D-TA family PLP-dependent enzyme [Pareuzebyella sediminis]
MKTDSWYEVENVGKLVSPGLLVDRDRILHNIRTMIAIAGGTEYLRPHIKTHKTAEIIAMQQDEGIEKFKCATIAEAELLARCQARDVLYAMQPVGANIERFFELIRAYPDVTFSALVDNKTSLALMAEKAQAKAISISLWVDINNGMNRTGIFPDEEALELFIAMEAHPHVEPMGLHVYDGHLRHTDYQEREKYCNEAFSLVNDLKHSIEANGIKVKGIVAGGSPTFPFHGKREGVEASPGTTLLWDAGYGKLFPEMDFLPAAVLITRIISKPAPNLLCLDLGHKHLASEMPFPRVVFMDNETFTQTGQSEEHLVVTCENAKDYNVGDVCYAIPVHICPTVAKYESLHVISKGKVVDSWKVAARNPKITI